MRNHQYRLTTFLRFEAVINAELCRFPLQKLRKKRVLDCFTLNFDRKFRSVVGEDANLIEILEGGENFDATFTGFAYIYYDFKAFSIYYNVLISKNSDSYL